jgi:hypothetical protein
MFCETANQNNATFPQQKMIRDLLPHHKERMGEVLHKVRTWQAWEWFTTAAAMKIEQLTGQMLVASNL